MPGQPGASRRPQQLQRDHNLSLVMRALREHGAASRSDLARHLGLDRSTLTHLSQALLDAGLIIESGERAAGARGGRRPRTLMLNPEGFQVLGVDIRSHDAKWVLVRPDGSIRRSGVVTRTTSGDATGEAPDHAVAWLERVVGDVAREAGLPLSRDLHRHQPDETGIGLLGVGLSVPGLVKHESALLTESVELGVSSVSLAEIWDGLDVPVHADNDANCCLWNLADIPGGPRNTLLCRISLHQDPDGSFRESGAGIGLGLLLGGSLYYGANDAAGEIRGARWLSGSPDQLGLALNELQESRGTAAALRALAEETLRTLSVVVSAADPDQLVVTGDADRLEPLITGLLNDELAGSPVATLAARGGLDVAGRERYPAAHGAARMVLSHLYSMPQRLNGAAQTSVWQRLIARPR